MSGLSDRTGDPTLSASDQVCLTSFMRTRSQAMWPRVQWVLLAVHRGVRELEPWGILLAVLGLGFTLWSFQIERANREEDRINRAISQFGSGIGRIDALAVLLRNAVDLRALKASNAFLPGAPLIGADLEFADFSDANLIDANLSNANLTGVTFRDAYLSGADFSKAILLGADLRDTNLSGADFSDAYLVDANLSGTNLHEADLSGAILGGANLSGADLSGTYYLGKADFFGAERFCATIMPDGSLCNRDCGGDCEFLIWRGGKLRVPTE